MTEERFIEIMKDGSVDISNVEDNALEGLLIMRKWLKGILIQGADHDIIYGPNVEELVESGITEEDIIAIRKLNWMVYDGYLACYV